MLVPAATVRHSPAATAKDVAKNRFVAARFDDVGRIVGVVRDLDLLVDCRVLVGPPVNRALAG